MCHKIRIGAQAGLLPPFSSTAPFTMPKNEGPNSETPSSLNMESALTLYLDTYFNIPCSDVTFYVHTKGVFLCMPILLYLWGLIQKAGCSQPFTYLVMIPESPIAVCVTCRIYERAAGPFDSGLKFEGA